MVSEWRVVDAARVHEPGHGAPVEATHRDASDLCGPDGGDTIKRRRFTLFPPARPGDFSAALMRTNAG